MANEMNNAGIESDANTQPAEVSMARKRKAAHMIARAWFDPEFKNKLLEKPEDAFAEYGLEVPSNKKIRVMEDTSNLTHFVLPTQPGESAFMALDRLSTAGLNGENNSIDPSVAVSCGGSCGPHSGGPSSGFCGGPSSGGCGPHSGGCGPHSGGCGPHSGGCGPHSGGTCGPHSR